jgi:hypothetical protein
MFVTSEQRLFFPFDLSGLGKLAFAATAFDVFQDLIDLFLLSQIRFWKIQ